MSLLKLLYEYSKGAKNKLIKKFQKENPQLEDNTILAYIDRFKQIKQNLDEPDIMKYTWKELEGTIDSYKSKKDKKTKGSVIKTKNKDKDLLYDKDGILVFKGSSKEKCIELGSGTDFCISSTTDGMNMYDTYRKKGGGATPYFIFNNNLPKDHRYYLIVIYAFYSKDNVFSLTDAFNDHKNEQAFKSFEEMMSFFDSTDQYGGEVWGFKPTFLKDILGGEELDLIEYLDMDKVEINGNNVVYNANINIAASGLTELPDFETLLKQNN